MDIWCEKLYPYFIAYYISQSGQIDINGQTVFQPINRLTFEPIVNEYIKYNWKLESWRFIGRNIKYHILRQSNELIMHKVLRNGKEQKKDISLKNNITYFLKEPEIVYEILILTFGVLNDGYEYSCARNKTDYIAKFGDYQ